MSIPSIDIIFDTSLIPSLPGAGGKVSHADLIGRSSHPARLAIPTLPGIGIPVGGLSVGDTVVLGHKRSNSFGGATNPASSGNRAGEGAGDVAKVPKGSKEQRKGHARTPSDSTIPTLTEKSLPSIPLKQRKKTPRQSHHGRSLSPLQAGVKHARSASVDPSSLSAPPTSAISLGDPSDGPDISALTARLTSLIPPSRFPSSTPPPGTLAPTSLLIPLTLVLEALVLERSILRGHSSASLPLLPDGVRLTLRHGDGSLDWNVMGMYLHSLASCMDELLPHLRSSADEERVGELLSTVRTYVAKAKKVFGEVAGMYVDGYGFVRGWWDEGAMKECAGVVGKLGDIFDA